MISVIVPVYQVEAWIDRCVASVLSQTYKDFELLLIDDGSTDSSGFLCDSWAQKDARVKVLHKQNGGLSDARNHGLEHSVGEYVTFVDSDDYIAPNYLEYLFYLINKCPDAGFSEGAICECRSGRCYPRDESGRVLVLSAHECLSKLMYDDQVYVSACGKLFKRYMFEKLRFIKGAAYEDSYAYKDYFEVCDQMIYGGTPIYYYVTRPESITTAKFNYRCLKDHFDSYDQLSAYAVRRFPDLKSARRRYLSFSRMRTLRQMKGVLLKYKELSGNLRREVLADSLHLLVDPKVPKRDKAGVLALYFGMNFYLWAWDMYGRFRK